MNLFDMSVSSSIFVYYSFVVLLFVAQLILLFLICERKS